VGLEHGGKYRRADIGVSPLTARFLSLCASLDSRAGVSLYVLPAFGYNGLDCFLELLQL
jgi:hypothetical protein